MAYEYRLRSGEKVQTIEGVTFNKSVVQSYATDQPNLNKHVPGQLDRFVNSVISNTDLATLADLSATYKEGAHVAASVAAYQGAGVTATQTTSRTNAVTITGGALSGAIVTNNSSLAAESSASFTINNSMVNATDVISTSVRSGTNSGNTDITVTGVTTGSFTLTVSNNNAAAGTAETGTITINFLVQKVT